MVDPVVVVDGCHSGETKQHPRGENLDAVFRENDIISDQHAGVGDGSVLSNKANEVSQLSRFGDGIVGPEEIDKSRAAVEVVGLIVDREKINSGPMTIGHLTADGIGQGRIGEQARAREARKQVDQIDFRHPLAADGRAEKRHHVTVGAVRSPVFQDRLGLLQRRYANAGDERLYAGLRTDRGGNFGGGGGLIDEQRKITEYVAGATCPKELLEQDSLRRR